MSVNGPQQPQPKIEVTLNPTTPNGEAKSITIANDQPIFQGATQEENVYASDIFSDGVYSQEEYDMYNEAMQAAIQAQYNEDIEWSAYSVSYTYDADGDDNTTNDRTAISAPQATEAANGAEEVSDTEEASNDQPTETAENPGDNEQAEPQKGTEYFADKYPGYPDNMSEEDAAACQKEQDNMLNAMFGQQFADAYRAQNPDATDDEVAAYVQSQIDAMNPSQNFWEEVQYNPETGDVSLNFRPFDGKSDLDGPWKFMHELYGIKHGYPQDIFEIITGRSTFTWSDPISFSGNTNNDGKTVLGNAPQAGDDITASQDPAAPEDPAAQDPAAQDPAATEPGSTLPPDDTDGEDINVSEPDADGKVKVGNGANDEEVDFKDPNIEPDGQGNYSGETEDGRFAVISSENGVTTVKYYDMNDVENGALKEGAQETSSTTHNRDGSTVNTRKDGDNTIETRTSANSQTTSITKDKDENVIKVTIGNEVYESPDYSCRINEEGNPELSQINGEDGVTLVVIGKDGSITVQNQPDLNGNSATAKIYGPDGSLQNVIISANGEQRQYDMSGYEYDPATNTYTKTTKSDGSETQSITIGEKGEMTISETNNGNTTSATYDNGELQSVVINGQTYSTSDTDVNGNSVEPNLIKTEDGYAIVVDGVEKPLKQNANGVFEIDFSKTDIASFNDSKLTLPDGEIEFATIDEASNGTYKGEDTNGNYVVVTTDADGTVTVKTYESEEAYNEDPNNTISDKSYGKDGSKSTTENGTDASGNEYTTTTTTDADGKTSTVTTTKIGDTTVETRTSDDGQTTSVTKDKSGNITEMTLNGVKYTYNEEMGGYVSEDGNVKLDHFEPLENGGYKVTEGNVETTYGPDGSMEKMVINGQEYDMSGYKYDPNTGKYTKIVTSDKSIVETITIGADGSITVENDQRGDSKDDTIKYDKNGNITEMTIDGVKYGYNDKGQLCELDSNGDPTGKVVELEGPDERGRYSIKKDEAES